MDTAAVPDMVRVAMALTQVPVMAPPTGAGLGAMAQTTQITDTRAVMRMAVPSSAAAVVDPVVMAARLAVEVWAGNAERQQHELQFRGQRVQAHQKTR